MFACLLLLHIRKGVAAVGAVAGKEQVDCAVQRALPHRVLMPALGAVAREKKASPTSSRKPLRLLEID